MKIRICCEYPHGACSYYRSMGVFPKLRHLNPNIEVELTEQIDWFFMSDADIIYMERPQTPNMKRAAHLVKDFGLKLWIDFDDNLFCLPDYNPNKQFFDSPTTKNIIIDCVKIADVVTVTTQSIKEDFKKYNKNIIIIPNAFNDYNYQLPLNPSNNRIIQWRGSITHREDLLSCSNEVFDIAADNPEWCWSFVGNDLWYMTKFISNSRSINEMPSIQYWKYIKNVGPSIQIVPLMFNRFNEGKSNISWIEGIYSGAVAVAPCMPEWEKPGIETYKTPEEFKENFEILMKSEKRRYNNFDLSLEYIKDNLLLSNINKKRIEVIEQLMEEPS